MYYEIFMIKESQGTDNKKNIDIFTKDLMIHSYNLIAFAETEKRRQNQIQSSSQTNKTKLDLKLIPRLHLDILKALDMGIVPFHYFLKSKRDKINFTSFESSIQRKSRQFYLADDLGNIFHIGYDGKLKGQLMQNSQTKKEQNKQA